MPGWRGCSSRGCEPLSRSPRLVRRGRLFAKFAFRQGDVSARILIGPDREYCSATATLALVESCPRLHFDLACSDIRETGDNMPFRRGGFALTPPSVVVFVISLVLAVLALLVHYGHVSVPIINSSRVFDVLAIAYIVL